MMHFNRYLLVLCAFLAFAESAQAQYTDGTRWLFRLGAEMGGDKVLQFEYSDGSTPDVPAGSGLVLLGGIAKPVWSNGSHAAEAQLNVGLKYRTIPPASNQEATWLRFPVEGLVMYRGATGFRAGAGVAVHVANTLKASGEALNDEVTFETTPGFVLQADYLVGQWSLDLRYTAMSYEPSGSSSSVNASSIGAGATFWFGKAAPRARR